MKKGLFTPHIPAHMVSEKAKESELLELYPLPLTAALMSHVLYKRARALAEHRIADGRRL